MSPSAFTAWHPIEQSVQMGVHGMHPFIDFFPYNTSFIMYTDNDNLRGSILGVVLDTIYNSPANLLTCPYPLNLLGYK